MSESKGKILLVILAVLLLLSGGGTIITPSTISARKNFGVMFSGSR